MEREVRSAIDSAVSGGASYADARCSCGDTTNIVLKNEKMEDVTTGNSFSAGVRVLYGGSWGFASTDNASELSKCADTALRIAKSLQSLNKSKDVVLADTAIIEKNIECKYKRNLKDMSIDERVDFVKDGHKAASKFSKEVKSVSAMYSDCSTRCVFVSSEGSYIVSNPQYFKYYVFSNTRRGDRREEAFRSFASFSGVDELVKKDPAKLGVSASKDAVKLLSASLPPSGVMPVILNPVIGGLFVHEAIGHASEADHMKSSVFNSHIGDVLGSECLNIADDPTLKARHGSYMYDSEGVSGKKTVIFRKGVLESYLHSRETAGLMGVEPTGNGRAQSPEYQPIVRMSNTYFGRGDRSFDELLEGVKKGLYMKGYSGGEVNPIDGTFTFGVSQGYIIENGEKTTLVKDCAMSGQILTVLKNIDAAGKDFSVDSAGFCGKDGQYVPVSDGGPHFRVSELLVGGQR